MPRGATDQLLPGNRYGMPETLDDAPPDGAGRFFALPQPEKDAVAMLLLAALPRLQPRQAGAHARRAGLAQAVRHRRRAAGPVALNWPAPYASAGAKSVARRPAQAEAGRAGVAGACTQHVTHTRTTS